MYLGLKVVTSLERAERLLTQLIVDAERIHANFSVSRQVVMSEAVMMKSAKKRGLLSSKSYH